MTNSADVTCTFLIISNLTNPKPCCSSNTHATGQLRWGFQANFAGMTPAQQYDTRIPTRLFYGLALQRWSEEALQNLPESIHKAVSHVTGLIGRSIP